MSVFELKTFSRYNLSVNQILYEYRPANQSLRDLTVQTVPLKVLLKLGEIGQELPVDTGSTVDSTLLPPELSRLHCKPTSKGIEFVQFSFDHLEGTKPVF